MITLPFFTHKKHTPTSRNTPILAHISRFVKCTLVIFLALILSTPLHALTEAQLDMFAENNILFYDPEETDDCSTSGGFISNGTFNEIGQYVSGLSAPYILEQFAIHTLKALAAIKGVPEADVLTKEKVALLVANYHREGGDINNDSIFNPMNLSGGATYDGDGEGRGRFESFDAGVLAYAKQFGRGNQSRLGDVLVNPNSTYEDWGYAFSHYDEFPGNKVWAVAAGLEGEKEKQDDYTRQLNRLYLQTIANYSVRAGLVIGTAAFEAKTNDRRDDLLVYDSLFSNASSASPSTNSVDGWLGGIEGLSKQDAVTVSLGETPPETFATTDGKPSMIILHYTAGTSNGLSAYPAGNMFPAHFTIDLKKRETYQHFPLTKPSLAVVGYDRYAIQFEIVGVGYDDWAGADPASPYNFINFTDAEWDYLAVFLSAVSQATGIPLTSSVTWDKSWSSAGGNTSTMTDAEAQSYRGILGHMHLPSNDHKSDPGDIWDQVKAAIDRNPSAPIPAGCAPAGLVSGGMNLAQAKQFMQLYRDIQPREWGVGGTLGTEWDIAATTTCVSDLENCVAFSQYFINRYTEAYFAGLPEGGKVVGSLLGSGKGFTDGGTTPRPYAIFSKQGGEYGHTGVILGVDVANGKVIIGEASCSNDISFTDAKEKELSEYSSGAYAYAYTDGILKGI